MREDTNMNLRQKIWVGIGILGVSISLLLFISQNKETSFSSNNEDYDCKSLRDSLKKGEALVIDNPTLESSIITLRSIYIDLCK